MLFAYKSRTLKTFFEHFLDEIAQKQEAGEIDTEKARHWITEIERQLQKYARDNPLAPSYRCRYSTNCWSFRSQHRRVA